MNTKQIEFYLNRDLTAIDLSKIDFSTTVSEFISNKEHASTYFEEDASREKNSYCVVLGEDSGRGELEYRVVDASLLLLPMLHGKQLITLAGISDNNGEIPRLHPLQELLKSWTKSCTIESATYIILSLFVHYNNRVTITVKEVKEIIPQQDCSTEEYEKLCRAVVEICNQKEAQKQTYFKAQKTQIFDQLWLINSHKEHKSWQRDNVSFYRANSLVDALQLLNKHPDATTINSTKDHHLGEKEPFETNGSIIEISAVTELEICLEDRNWRLFGTGMKIQELYQFLKKRLPDFAEILSNFGPFLVRNTLTIGSCLSSETTLRKLAPFLMVSQAELLFKTLEKNRIVTLKQFISQPLNQRTEPGELMALLRIPKRKNGALFYAKELSTQSSSKQTTLSIAACIEVKNQTVETIEIVFGETHHTPKYALNSMQILKGNPFTSEQFSKAIASLQADLQSAFSDKTELDLVTPLAQELLWSCYAEFNKKISAETQQ